MKATENQMRRLVDGVVRPVAEKELGRIEAAGAPAHEILDRYQTVWLFCHSAHSLIASLGTREIGNECHPKLSY